jgi:uncharacterized protein YndB with AHSA1/START domain
MEMSEPTVVHSTFVLERSYLRPPEHVFAAFADPAKKRRWFAPGDHHTVEEFTMDFRVGGAEVVRSRMGDDTPFPGVALVSEGSFFDIVPNRRVVSAATMSVGERHISTALATFELLPTEAGTDLIFTYQTAFFEGSDGPERREEGWRKLLNNLDAEIEQTDRADPA